MNLNDLDQTIRTMTEHLLAERVDGGHWQGRLATSALSTATAVVALSLTDAKTHDALIRNGLDWLSGHVNADGGWGDTVDSPSNINTTALCWAALGCSPEPKVEWQTAARGAETWIEARTGRLEPGRIVETILAFYGKDRTFSVPIVTLLALCGRLGPPATAFAKIPALPFELAAAPPPLWRWLQLPVVSYALPALVAIGQARFHHAPPAFGPLRGIRRQLQARTLQVVRRMQASSGGFLEAVPLTSFVVACLAAIGHQEHPVVRDGLVFLKALAREDGGWPIDTCLSTWVSVLAVHALASAGDVDRSFGAESQAAMREWLLGQQLDHVHPFTNVPSGGWAWMDTDGAVPDADDTPGALLALDVLDNDDPRIQAAAEQGVRWLLALQNRDGGMPTFCRGWGKLPFDRSSPDITAHSLRAWAAWQSRMPPALRRRLDRARRRARRYLARQQRADGSWLPLWFGNQACDDCTNPLYGTARVVKALADTGEVDMAERGVDWLLTAQGSDGGWGGAPGSKPSIEETALAIEALAAWRTEKSLCPACRHAIEQGVDWLMKATHGGCQFKPRPIGLYFAKLWYSERLYPVVFSLAALSKARQRLGV